MLHENQDVIITAFKDVIDVSIARMNILLKKEKEEATNAEIKDMTVVKRMITYMNNDDSRFFVNRDNFKHVIELFPAFCKAIKTKYDEIDASLDTGPLTTFVKTEPFPTNLLYYIMLCRYTASELLPEMFEQYDFAKETLRNGHETEFNTMDYDKQLLFHVPKTREAEVDIANNVRTMGAFILSVSAPPQTLDKLKSDIFYKKIEKNAYFVLDDKNQTVRETKEVHEERLILDPRKVANATMTDDENSETWTLRILDLVRYLRDVGFDDIYFYDVSCDSSNPIPESAQTWVGK
jgi:hypothetical protein